MFFQRVVEIRLYKWHVLDQQSGVGLLVNYNIVTSRYLILLSLYASQHVKDLSTYEIIHLFSFLS